MKIFHKVINWLLFSGLDVIWATYDCEQVVLRAVKGRDALLPCGQGRVFLDGPKAYVLWMKDTEFLYRFPEDDSLTMLPNLRQEFDGRCEGNFCPDPTSVKLEHVGNQQEGFYRCRIHYQASPAVDFLIELRIVDPPGSPRIFNDKGNDVSGGILPLTLGADTTLTCEVKESTSDTLVWWEKNGESVARAESVQDGILRIEMQIKKASRNELNAHYECLVQNADVTDPLSTSVIVKMHLPPMTVEIRLNNNLNFEAGLPRVVDCVVVGCVPPPTITWHLGNVMLRPSVHKELHEGNFTVSSLTLAPSLRDDKHELSCRVHNSHLPEDIFEDKVVLNVGFRPTCLNDREVVIGYVDDQPESVTCTVDAYPAPMLFSWTFADTRILSTSGNKVAGYEHRYSSTLTWKPQEKDEGELLCRATNSLGEQKQPCVYPIVAGGPPLTPDCQLIETNIFNVKLTCKRRWDGGRPQKIHLELKNWNGLTLSNVTDDLGDFAFPQGLEPNMTAVVYASNSRGRSDTKQIPLIPSPAATGQTTMQREKNALEKRQREAYWIGAGVIAGVFFGLVLVAKCMIWFTKKLGIKPPAEYGTEEVEAQRTDTTRSDGSFLREQQFDPDVMVEDPPYPHVTVTVPSNDNMYVVDPPIPRYKQPAKVVGVRQVKFPPHGLVFCEMDENLPTYHV